MTEMAGRAAGAAAETTPEPKPRNTTRQREAGAAARAETRRRLLHAAGAEFADRGYAGATVARIAARAGVTVQTLYLAWGSKIALLRAHLVGAIAGLPDEPDGDIMAAMAQLPGERGDAATTIAQIAAHYCHVAGRAAGAWQLYRDAAAGDPEVAADWRQLQVLRLGTFRSLLAALPTGALRSGLSAEAAAETAWTIASPDTYDLLVRHRGYSLDRYEAWVRDTLTAALLDPAA